MLTAGAIFRADEWTQALPTPWGKPPTTWPDSVNWMINRQTAVER